VYTDLSELQHALHEHECVLTFSKC